jgi:hypothetical protein
MSRDRIPFGGLISLTLILHAVYGYAQEEGRRPPTHVVPPGQTTEGETLKERLSGKASDEQRVDNCKVPVDRRGPKIRPEGCSQDDASGAAPTKPPR